MYKVGIGVITIQKRELHPNLLNLISRPTQFYVYTDYERRGPAYGRNECIKNLYEAGCDFIFLFDDDTYPQLENWQEYLIGCHEQSGYHCFSYPDKRIATLYKSEDLIDFWAHNTGCFKSITRELVEMIGYFNTAYKTYGHEDIAYLYRARASGLSGDGMADASPKLIHEYIFSEDISGNPTIHNMTVAEKTAAIEANRPAFTQEVSSGVLYYPYTN
jgi:GT2 family glycosyltransferase